jgi:FMN phosphatase YigB (HAD superfamily)
VQTTSIGTIACDVGETLVDETPMWSRWADWLGVPREEFLAALDASIAEGRHHRSVFEHFRPGFDLDAAQGERIAAVDEPGFWPADLHLDVRPALAALKVCGMRIVLAANTSQRTEAFLQDLEMPVDLMTSSSALGVEKPAPEFFQKLAAAADALPPALLSVGDRLDNDVLAARAAGTAAGWIWRGRWAKMQARAFTLPQGCPAITRLTELPEPLQAELNGG